MAVTVADSAAPVLPPRWYAHGFNRACVYRAGAFVAGALPRRLRLALAGALAAAVRGRFAAESAVLRRNLARVVPEASARARERLVADVFRHFGFCFADLITANRGRRVDGLLREVRGLHHLQAAFREGRGLVVLTAHLGNWELAGRTLASEAARPTHVVVAPEPDPAVGRFLRGGPAPVRFVTRTQPTDVLGLIGALRRNEVVAMQGDRALGTRGDVRVPFFGADAPFPMGPFVLARAAGAPVVPAFCTLGPDRRYTVTVEPAIVVGADDGSVALARWVGALETAVRRAPEQWFNFYDVWEAQPAR